MHLFLGFCFTRLFFACFFGGKIGLIQFFHFVSHRFLGKSVLKLQEILFQILFGKTVTDKAGMQVVPSFVMLRVVFLRFCGVLPVSFCVCAKKGKKI